MYLLIVAIIAWYISGADSNFKQIWVFSMLAMKISKESSRMSLKSPTFQAKYFYLFQLFFIRHGFEASHQYLDVFYTVFVSIKILLPELNTAL